MNGLHGFTGDGYQNFDPNQSNSNIYVIESNKACTDVSRK